MKAKPDRSDYELWFTDWLDGRLSHEQAETFLAFLKQNPDIAGELNDLKLVSLEPPEITFPGKDSLRRSPESLGDEQFDNLCIASLENDLASGEQEELDYLVSLDENKRKNYELIKRLRLKPAAVVFGGKGTVKKLTAGGRIFRYSLTGLSMAAALTLLITMYLFIKSAGGDRMISRLFAADTFLIELRTGLSVVSDQVIVEKPAPHAAENSKMLKPERAEGKYFPGSDEIPAGTESVDPDAVISREMPPASMAVMVTEIQVDGLHPVTSVLRQFNPSIATPEAPDLRSNVDRFLARIFHEIIMSDTISGDRPVKSYDLAKAGITGINKLLGWEMALDKRTDEKGETRSYNFSSRLLKFNAPAKKTNEL